MPAPPFLSAEVLLKERRVETSRLEFKATWDDQTKPAIIHTICAFANDLHDQNGGYIIIGVEAPKGLPVLPPRGLPPDSIEKIQEAINGQVQQYIKPEYLPRLDAQIVDGRHILVVHCPAGDNRPYVAPEHLGRGTAATAIHRVRSNSETRKAIGELRRQLDEVCRRTPFDAQPCRDLTANDLSFDLVESFLRRAKSKLVGQEIPVDAKLRGLDLLQQVNGHEAPRNAALLFFKSEPWRRFRGARIDIVARNNTGTVLHEQEITGTLPTLIEQTLTALNAHNSVLVRKHDNRAEADRDSAWPFLAIEEVVVNAVHHRGYDPENPDAIKIDIYPDRIVVTSYPGPMPGLTHDQLDRAEVVNVRARNKHVGELLKAIELAETRSSGIRTIRQAMEKAGNPPPQFAFDEERTYFRVTLPIHPAHLRHATALPVRLGVPAPAGEIVGRDTLIAQVNRTLQWQNVCLFAPRGRGVSSVLNGLDVAPTGERRHHLDMRRQSEEQFEQHVDDLLMRRADGDRLVFLLDHCTWDDNEAIFRLIGHSDVRVVVAPEQLPSDAHRDWWSDFELIVVPPLSSADTRSLAARLLAGIGRDHADGLVLSIEQATAGIPHLVHLLVSRIYMAPKWGEPDSIDELLQNLITQRGDPTGLRERSDSAYSFARTFPRSPALALDRTADAPAGLTHDDLRAGLLGGSISPREADLTLRGLLDEGYLVERDGRIMFEHPYLQKVWQTLRNRAPGSENDDLPF
jgi:predicted HTH transcriptional regulator